MTDASPRQLTIPLDFLGRGTFVAEVYADDRDAPDRPSNVVIRRLQVAAGDSLQADLAPAGGQAARFTPVH